MLCPACRSKRTRKAKSIDARDVVALWNKLYQIDVRPELKGVAVIELWACKDCLVRFFVPESLAGSGHLYSQLENIDWYYPKRKWEYEVAVKDLRERQKVLEIGCGSGNFMLFAKEEAGLSLEGLEQNPRAVEEATRIGLRVIAATAEERARTSPSVYDAICSFQVLEHVPRPCEFLDACCALLKPGGLLVLAVPNQNSYVRRMVNPLDMPPHHMTRWTPRCLSRIPWHFPLKLLHTKIEPLTDNQVELYMDTYVRVFQRLLPRGNLHPGIYSRIFRFIMHSGIRRFMRGQNIYACYLRD
jgi:2-polyprenyl-3-methyl-5-hydroxy-6-metoxy-1,4-benzoquinol methylase